jgi:hypothetical protein
MFSRKAQQFSSGHLDGLFRVVRLFFLFILHEVDVSCNARLGVFLAGEKNGSGHNMAHTLYY